MILVTSYWAQPQGNCSSDIILYTVSGNGYSGILGTAYR